MDRIGTTNGSGVNISSMIFRSRGVRGWRIAGVRGDEFASIEKKNLKECGIFHHPTNRIECVVLEVLRLTNDSRARLAYFLS